jgi:hypothetical protein
VSTPRHANRSRGTLLAALALVLLGTLVIGSEDRRREDAIAAAPPLRQAPAVRDASDEELDIAKLQRFKRAAPIVDVFTPKTAAVPVSAPTPPPIKEEPSVPPPAAPPALPFRFVGKFSEDGAVRLLIVNGEKEHHIAGGETLEGTYSVDKVTDEAVVFTYLPLKVEQTLPLPSADEAAR